VSARDERTHIEKTVIILGPENATKAILNFLYSATGMFVGIGDSSWPSVAMGIEVFKNAMADLKRPNVSCRFVTEITKENISYCKQLMEIAELRHLEGIKGDFAVHEKGCMAFATRSENNLLLQVIYSNSKEIIEQQRYLFETLWDKSIPAWDRIKEIEEGKELEFLDVLTDHEKAMEIYTELSRNIEKEALLLLPDSRDLIRDHQLGVLDNLILASKNKSALIRIICPLNENNKKIVEEISEKAPNIKIIAGDKSSSKLLVVDGKRYFMAETKKDEANTFIESIGFAIYSNSRQSIISFKSFFDLLWDSSIRSARLSELTDKMKSDILHFEEIDMAKEEFSAMISHELKTPLTVIKGYLSLLLHGGLGNLTEKQVQVVKIMFDNTECLSQLIQDILDIRKMELGRLKLNVSDTSSKYLLKQCVDAFEPTCKERGITLVDKAQADITFKCDVGRVLQVLNNIVSNSVKFVPAKAGIIEINAVADNGSVIFSIKDNGVGIPKEKQKNLFKKFYQVDTSLSRESGGSGLGLVISRGIVEAHGGRIWINSEENKGTTVYFSMLKGTNA
jgi:signal transduction histidine kinase